MKIDNSGFNSNQLGHFIEQTFSIGSIKSVRFIPKGEEGYVYRVNTESGNDYIVKVQKPNEHVDFVLALNSVSDLHFHHRLNYVVAPVQTFTSKNIARFEDKWISLFSYIKGDSLYDLGDFTSDLERIAKMMAELHNVNIKKFDQLPIEMFQNPFEETILKLLYRAEHQDFSANKYQHKTATLLVEQKKDIEATLAKMRNIQKKLSDGQIELAITHGDANFANILRDEQDHLHMIDWVEIGIAPVERDMMSFIEVDGKPLDFKRFLSSYLVHRPRTIINHEVFEFYLYRWCLQEIADYGSRILLKNSKTEEYKNSWIELQPYLPISHQSIQERLNEIKNCYSLVNDTEVGVKSFPKNISIMKNWT